MEPRSCISSRQEVHQVAHTLTSVSGPLRPPSSTGVPESVVARYSGRVRPISIRASPAIALADSPSRALVRADDSRHALATTAAARITQRTAVALTTAARSAADAPRRVSLFGFGSRAAGAGR